MPANPTEALAALLRLEPAPAQRAGVPGDGVAGPGGAHAQQIGQHLARGVEIAVGIVEERHVEHAAAFVRQHRIIRQFFRLPAFAAGLVFSAAVILV